MSSSSSNSTSPIISISRPSGIRLHGGGSLIRGEYIGDPIVSFFDPQIKQGALVLISASRIAEDLEMSFSNLKNKLPSGGSLASLQCKVIAPLVHEEKIRAAFGKEGLTIASYASDCTSKSLECFFYTDTGRLRVAPLEQKKKVDEAVPVRTELSRIEPSRVEVVKPKGKARVLIVDDSKTMRQLLRKIIDASPELEVVAEAERPSQVEKLLEDHKPDVMTLDINMPEMSGVELLRRVLAKRFIPTVMISSLSMEEGNEVLNALEIGAVDYIHKPAANEMVTVVPIIQEKIAEASRVKRRAAEAGKSAGVSRSARLVSRFESSKLIAIGASTGGTEAIKEVFINFPENTPPIAVVQHIPPYFSAAFANRLNQICKFEVREAKDGDEFLPGLCLIAPGGFHMEVTQSGSKLVARVYDGPLVNRFKPSVDVLFNSVAKVLGKKATGVLMTGMGSDGASGLLAMKNAGSYTIAQDQESCVVFGMPRAAIELGAATDIKSLGDISVALMKAA